MPPDDDSALLDVAHSCREIAALVRRTDRAAFLHDEVLRPATKYHLMVLGEAVKRLSPQFREQHPETRWPAIAGLRDILIHAYERVDDEQIWEIAAVSVPGLLVYIEPLLPRDPGAGRV